MNAPAKMDVPTREGSGDPLFDVVHTAMPAIVHAWRIVRESWREIEQGPPEDLAVLLLRGADGDLSVGITTRVRLLARMEGVHAELEAPAIDVMIARGVVREFGPMVATGRLDALWVVVESGELRGCLAIGWPVAMAKGGAA